MIRKSFQKVFSAAPSTHSTQTIQNTRKVLKLENIGTLLGFNSKDEFVTQHNCDVIISEGKILSMNPHNKEEEKKSHHIDSDGQVERFTLDCSNKLVTPGFVDPHTHMFPPNDRSNEFSMRVTKTYQEIAAAGGGILSSVKACRQSDEEDLYLRNKRSIERFIHQGTTTVEMKSGYGLDTENELKQLRVIRRLQEEYADQIEIVATFLGAHAFPPEYKQERDAYVDLICKEMIPEVAKQGIAEYCDVFCENGYFSAEQAERLLVVARDHGMKLRLHADEFEDSHAAELAGKLKAHSADHLMAISDLGIKSLAENNVVATMLPGTTIFLGKNSFAPARKMINAGCRVAIATDCNPGSSNFNSQPMMMNFCMTYGKLSLEEAYKGVTRNSAVALDRWDQGIIDLGAQADLIVWDGIDRLDQIPYYHYESSQFISHVVKRGHLHSKINYEHFLNQFNQGMSKIFS